MPSAQSRIFFGSQAPIGERTQPLRFGVFIVSPDGSRRELDWISERSRAKNRLALSDTTRRPFSWHFRHFAARPSKDFDLSPMRDLFSDFRADGPYMRGRTGEHIVNR
jgi:hypothetical protein